MMTISIDPMSLVPDKLLRKAIYFANIELPELKKVKREWNCIVFEYVEDEPLPVNKLRYQHQRIDKYALAAFQAISKEECCSELNKGFYFTFLVYFRHHDSIAGGMQFNYFLDNELFFGN